MNRYNSARLVLLLTLLIITATGAFARQLQKTDSAGIFELIMDRVRESHLTTDNSKLENSVVRYSAKLQKDGSFKDINYSDRAQTAWTPLAHLDRLGNMVTAYVKVGNKYYQNEKLYADIVSALNFWYDKHPTSTNWFMQQIAAPQRMGVLLILMKSGKKQLPVDLENKLIVRMEIDGNRPDQHGSLGTGANKMDIATHWIYRACLLKNPDMLDFAVNQAFYPLMLTVNEGLQHDYSYHQHGDQLYIGGYGYVIVEGMTKLASFLRDTPYALPGAKKQLLCNFLLKSYLPTIRGQYYLYNILGRGISRENSLNQASFAAILRRMILLDSDNGKIYADAIQRLTGKQKADYALTPTSTHFWRSDYTLHQRSAYTFDVRTASIYTSRNENGNGEGLDGYFLTDGATTIVRNGDEYYNVFPVWDWAAIPGVTNPAMKEIPRPSPWQTPGTSEFAGGVSDNIYSVSTYVLNDTAYNINTSAKKSWFMFDNEIVCLGSGINSEAKENIHTTVNQCLLKGEVVVCERGNAKKIANNTNQRYTDLSWVLHDGVGYYFPEKSSITVSNQIQRGAWSSINTSASDRLIEKGVFKLWFDHGVSPQNDEYAYYVIPDVKSVSEMQKYAYSHLSILQNTDEIQAVVNTKANILGIVFYKPGSFSNSSVSVTVDKACVLLIKGFDKATPELYVADPGRKESLTKIALKTKFVDAQQDCSFTVYPDAYAGSTVKYTLN